MKSFHLPQASIFSLIFVLQYETKVRKYEVCEW